MSPISGLTPNVSSVIPTVDTLPPEASPIPPDATPLPSTNGIQMPSELAAPSGISGAQGSTNSFASMLGQFVSDVNSQSQAAGQAVSALQSGQNIPLHQAVIQMEESNISFQLMVEVRNRLLDSYQEIMRMQV